MTSSRPRPGVVAVAAVRRSGLQRRSSARRLVVALLFLFPILFVPAQPVTAQVIGGPRPAQTADRELGFLTRYHVRTQAAGLAGIGEEQFGWDTDLGVDMDVFDLLFARGNVFFNLETGVGGERRAIDPTQTNYTMDLSVFTRLPRGEFGVTLHHISRHRADREHPGSPSWNMLGLSYGDRLRLGAFDVALMGRWLGTITSSEVDYEQEANAHLRVLRPLTGRVSLIAELDGSAVLTDESMFGREHLYGGSAHLGLRFRGSAGAGEILIGRERRVDPDIFVRRPIRWTRWEFRFVVD
ncbi:MAG: hypothetical protein F4018_13690 [Acidobacteria bacterium]|nr:hypothetical protein [Acidobacteriota bacterium]MYK89294.1 hypothetical protein [Acidobacteriota bacterium]